jgi:hypothetical protein
MAEKTPAEFQAEVANKAIEQSILSASLLSGGYREAGIAAWARAEFLADYAEELSKPPRIIIVGT